MQQINVIAKIHGLQHSKNTREEEHM